MHGGLDTKHSHRVEGCEATKPRRAQDDDTDDDPCTLHIPKDTRTLDVVVVVVGECSMFVRKRAQAPSSSMLAVCI
jgi:hypothetical protein